ncbi:MAG: hypothetical protein HY290_02275 [Planctomycetia bacterium]|nr:hypothetical protein [Planctomycetia bacterium]
MYQKLVVIGSGRVAQRTLEAVLRVPQHPEVVAVEPEAPLTEAFAPACRRHGIACSRIVDRDALVAFFTALPEKTLVLSAHNVLIFPPALTDSKRLTIVNFHNALLPRHRGRNAPSWALYERDPWVGITWHRVTAGIDEGEVVCQRRIRPTWDMTALTLTQALVDLGIDALTDLLPELLSRSLRTTPQDTDIAPSFHRASEVPNCGYLDPGWSFAQASAFLRALDFGKLPLFPQARVRLDEGERQISGYRLIETGAFSPDPVARRAGDELEFCDADLNLTVSLASAGARSRRRKPVVARGNSR